MLANRNIQLLLASYFFALLGDQIYIVALAWQTQVSTTSIANVSLVLCSYTFCYLLCVRRSWVGTGPTGERSLLLTSVLTHLALVSTVIFLMPLSALAIWQLVILSALNGARATIFLPAFSNLQMKLITKKELDSFNALLKITVKAATIAGPLGGVILTQFVSATGAFIFDIIIILLAAGCVVFLNSSAVANALINDPLEVASKEDTNPRTLFMDSLSAFVFAINVFAFISLGLVHLVRAYLSWLISPQFANEVNIFGWLLLLWMGGSLLIVNSRLGKYFILFYLIVIIISTSEMLLLFSNNSWIVFLILLILGVIVFLALVRLYTIHTTTNSKNILLNSIVSFGVVVGGVLLAYYLAGFSGLIVILICFLIIPIFIFIGLSKTLN